MHPYGADLRKQPLRQGNGYQQFLPNASRPVGDDVLQIQGGGLAAHQLQEAEVKSPPSGRLACSAAQAFLRESVES